MDPIKTLLLHHHCLSVEKLFTSAVWAACLLCHWLVKPVSWSLNSKTLNWTLCQLQIQIYVYDIGDPIRHCLGHLRPPLEVLTSRQHLTRRGFRRSLLYEQNIYISESIDIANRKILEFKFMKTYPTRPVPRTTGHHLTDDSHCTPSCTNSKGGS